MVDLTSLLERVRAASAPDRELDAYIRAAFFDDMTFCDFETGCHHGDCASPGCGKPLGLHDERRSYPANWEDDERLPRYTGSIDAAVALVERLLPDFPWSIYKDEGYAVAAVGTSPRLDHCRAATPPLSILAALLTAMQKD